jgi:hypothetical protein
MTIKQKTFWLPLAVFVFELAVLRALSHDSVRAWLSGWTGVSPFWVEVSAWVVLVGTFAFLQHQSVYLPRRTAERLKRGRRKVLSSFADDILDFYREDDIELRMNVMMPRQVWLYSRIEPKVGDSNKRTWRWRPKLLEPFWTTHERGPDANLRFTENQGAAGDTYRSGDHTVVDLTVEDPAKYNLNADQLQKTEKLRFVASFPVFRFQRGERTLDREIIAVLNIDSISEGAERLIQDENSETYQDLMDHADDFAVLCSHVL